MALWGGRFSGAEDQALTDYSESISYDNRLFRHDVMGSKAHVTMLAEQKIIPEATAKAICAKLDEIRDQIAAGKMEFKAELEDIHMHVESALIAALGDEGARLHSGRSRNDQIALDVRLYLRDEIDAIASGMLEMQRALVSVADANDRVYLPGFTHLQHAQVVLFAHHLLAYVEMIERDKGRLADCRKRLNVMPLGSGALAGSTLPLRRERVAELLDFPAVTRNSMDAVADRDFAIELAGALSIFMMHMSRLSEDLILWSSQEFGFIELADAFCTGSSLMPQKKNPDAAELSRGKTARVYGDLMALLTLCKGLPLTYNRDLQEDKEPVFDAIDTVKKLLRVYPPMVATMAVRKERMAAMAGDPALMATDLAEKLVELGVPFRVAHHRVGSLVKYCKEHGKALDQVDLAEMRITIPEATPEFLTLFDPAASAGKRELTGGTGFKAVRSELDRWLAILAPER